VSRPPLAERPGRPPRCYATRHHLPCQRLRRWAVRHRPRWAPRQAVRLRHWPVPLDWRWVVGRTAGTAGRHGRWRLAAHVHRLARAHGPKGRCVEDRMHAGDGILTDSLQVPRQEAALRARGRVPGADALCTRLKLGSSHGLALRRRMGDASAHDLLRAGWSGQLWPTEPGRIHHGRKRGSRLEASSGRWADHDSLGDATRRAPALNCTAQRLLSYHGPPLLRGRLCLVGPLGGTTTRGGLGEPYVRAKRVSRKQTLHANRLFELRILITTRRIRTKFIWRGVSRHESSSRIARNASPPPHQCIAACTVD